MCSPDLEFITSDNPGFTLLPNEQLISFGGFGLAFKFIFPLTPKSCLFIKHDDLEENYLLKKSITVRNVDTGIVDTINRLTYSTSIEKVFAYSEYPLIPFTK